MTGNKRKMRRATVLSPGPLGSAATEAGLWYESPEEVEEGLKRGRERVELLRWIRKQMGRKLTPRERHCLELYYFEGLSYREVGGLTGTSMATAHRDVARSLRKLRLCAKRSRGLAKARLDRGMELGRNGKPVKRVK